MILFFIATSLFHENKIIEKKLFETTQTTTTEELKEKKQLEVQEPKKRFKLLESAY